MKPVAAGLTGSGHSTYDAGEALPARDCGRQRIGHPDGRADERVPLLGVVVLIVSAVITVAGWLFFFMGLVQLAG